MMIEVSKNRVVNILIPYACVQIAIIAVADYYLLEDISIAFIAILFAIAQLFLRPIAAAIIIIPAVTGLSVVNSMKEKYSGETLIWQDVRYVLPNLNDNIGTVLQYMTFELLFMLACVPVLLVLIIIYERRWLPCSRLTSAMFSVVLILMYVPPALGDIKKINNNLDNLFQNNAWTFSGHNKEHSAVSRFIRSLMLDSSDMIYRPVGADEFLRHIQENKISTPSTSAQKHPDVIVVLQESQFDPRQLSVCALRKDCHMEMFEASQGSMQFGPLHVHIFGASTWNSELAIMTGTPHTWYAGSGYQPYTIPHRVRHALGHHMSSLGYRTVVVYPVQRGMMNAYNAYRSYGMNEFYGSEDLKLPLSWCQVTDEVMYSKLSEIRNQLASEDDRPLFMVMLTIFNHGPHGMHCSDSDNTISHADTEEVRLTKKINDFLHRSQLADKEGNLFRKEIIESNRPSLILVAGDHQPSFEGYATELQRVRHREMPERDALEFTNYQFFSNYGKVALPVHRELDIIFLPSTLLELAGLPFGPVFSLNLRLRDICGGRLDQCPEGKFLDSYRNHLIDIGFYK